MKKTLFSLLACASLTAPAMATNWSPTEMFIGPTDDTYSTHYALYLLNVNNTSYEALTITLSSLTYEEFVAQYNSQLHIDAKTYFDGKVSAELAGDTGISTDTPASDLYATWVYNNGKTGDELVAKVAVATTYGYKGNMLSSDSSNSYISTSKWTSFSKTPEPATATLSLMALAGLAARRRRK